MSSSSTILAFPVQGMTCAACASSIENILNRLPGVKAEVNFASERVRVEYDREQVQPLTLIDSITKAGFSVPPESLMLDITGMTCAACRPRQTAGHPQCPRQSGLEQGAGGISPRRD